MRILVLGINSWDNRNAVGNTLSNWFENWSECEFAFMYTRSATPNNSCCRNYYQVTVFDIFKNIFSPNRIGKSFTCNATTPSAGNNIERSVVRKSSGTLASLIKKSIEFTYSTDIWFNKKAKDYIKTFNPDIVFTFVLGDVFRHRILNFVKSETDAKIVEFVADDVWEQLAHSHSFHANAIRKRITDQLHLADKVYGASKPLCVKYNALFNIEMSPLHKGAKISSVKDSTNTPITMVYAGNLLYGRDITLSHLADAVAQLNKETLSLQLEIYSNSTISDDVAEKLNKPDFGCHLYDVRPYEEIKEIMRKSDIVLHVESFRNEDINLVRYSFSTKIMDCLQSGSVMMTIGPEGIASVEYPKSIPGTFVVSDLSKIKEVLLEVVRNPESLTIRAKQINDYAQKHHNIDTVRTHLCSEFQDLINHKTLK